MKKTIYSILCGIAMIFLLNLNMDRGNLTMIDNEIDPYEIDKSGPKEIEGMVLVWNDEFNTEGLPNPDSWGYEYGFVRNHELQYYQPRNAYCKDGRLIITAKREKVDNQNYNPNSDDWRLNTAQAEYSSSCLITKGFHEWTKNGYFEIRARIESVAGSWPAIWLLGTQSDWPLCGEIDIMEFYRVDGQPTILANVAWASEKKYHADWSSIKKPLSVFTDSDPGWINKYHTWSMMWDEESIQLYLDGELLNSTLLKTTVNPDGINPFTSDQKFFLLLNLAVGSNGGDPSRTEFPIEFEVDYVRIYKKVQH